MAFHNSLKHVLPASVDVKGTWICAIPIARGEVMLSVMDQGKPVAAVYLSCHGEYRRGSSLPARVPLLTILERLPGVRSPYAY